MPGRAVYKNSTVEFLDAFFRGDQEPIETTFAYSRHLLDGVGDGSLVGAAVQLETDGRLPNGVGTSVDFQRFWLGPSSQLGDPDVDRVMRHGYQQAMVIASSHQPPLPIETLWITGASDTYEVHICEGTRQVTLLAFIPVQRHYGSSKATSRSWVVRVAEPGETAGSLDAGDPPVVMVQTSGKASAGA